MATRPPKRNSPAATGGIVLYGLHFIFDAFGTTNPRRLGVAVAVSLALDTPARILAAYYNVPLPSGFTLEYSLFGVAFTGFFLPGLFRPIMPEPPAERFLVINKFAKEIGLSKAEKRLLYLQLLEACK